MSLLQQIQSIQTHLPLEVELQLHSSLLAPRSLVCDIYPMKTDKQFVNVLLDNIRRQRSNDKAHQ